jgi:hypothetical protein
MRGITDGVTGLVTQPVKEAKAGGALGFMRGEVLLVEDRLLQKVLQHDMCCHCLNFYSHPCILAGVGMGLLGVAVKPMLGLADGVTSIVQGVSSVISNQQALSVVRPPRPLPWYASPVHHVPM